ncbi:MAG: hypothetical protein PHQ75_15205, partial [Thermoguttaceae bacterium]|nr:hypothetical protein [Thermoguttaceae bacterium]
TLGEDGVYRLGWTPTSSDSGYEYHVGIVATDSVGRQVTMPLVFRVGEGPSFNVFDADGDSVAGHTVNADEATSVAFTIDLTTDPEYDSTLDYTASYSLYKITTVDGAESRQLVDSGALTLANGIASWSRAFSESDGPGTYRVEFVAWLASTTDMTTTEAVGIEIAEVNLGPVITFVQDEPFSVEVGATQSWQLTATDSDVPAQTLVWSIDGTAKDCVTLTSDGTLTLTPTQADSDTQFVVKVIVSDGLLTDSMELSFVVPLWTDPGDNSDITVPDLLPTLSTPADCIAAWGNVNQYRLQQIQESKDRFLAAFTQAAETFKETISSLSTQLQTGTISREEYQVLGHEAILVKDQEQAKNAANLEARNAKINQYAQEQFDTIASTGSTLGVELSAENAMGENQPLHLTYAEMQQIWQASLPCFSALSASAVDAVLTSYLV